MLKDFPPLLGGVLKASFSAAVSVTKGTPGLQEKMNWTKADSIVPAVTFLDGRSSLVVAGAEACMVLRCGEFASRFVLDCCIMNISASLSSTQKPRPLLL